MDNSNQFSIFPAGGVTPPKGLNAVMQGLVREVLMKNPKDIFPFAAEYFEKLMEIRRSASSDESKEITNIVYLHQSYSDKGKIESIHPKDELPPMSTSGENLVVECLENRKDSRGEISVESFKDKFDFKEDQLSDLNEVVGKNDNLIENPDSIDVKISENIDPPYGEDKETNNRLITDFDDKTALAEALQNFDNHLIQDTENINLPEKVTNEDEQENLAIVDDSVIVGTELVENSDLKEISEVLNHQSDPILNEIQRSLSSEMHQYEEKEITSDLKKVSNDKENDQNEAQSETISHENLNNNEDEKILNDHSNSNSPILQKMESNEVVDQKIELSSDPEVSSSTEEKIIKSEENVNVDLIDKDSINDSISGSENREIINNEKNIDENLSQTETIAADYNLRKLEQDEIVTDKIQDSDPNLQNENNEEKEKEIKEITNGETEKDIFVKASIVIQKIYRGFMARSKVSQMIKNKKNKNSEELVEEKNDALENFSEPITQIIRANVEPILYTVPEEKNGSYSTEDESSTFSSAATKIQAGVRGFLTRKYLQHNKTNNSSDTTAPSIGEDSKSLEEIISTFESNSGEDPVSQIIVATSSILIEQLEHFEKLEGSQFQSTMSNIDSLEMSREGDDSKRKRLKREDAIQLHSPYSSGETSVNKYSPNKLSEDEEPIGDLAQSIISEIISSSYAKLEKISQAPEELETNGEIIHEEQYNIAKKSEEASEENVENTDVEPKIGEILNESNQEKILLEMENESEAETNLSNSEKVFEQSEKKLVSHESFQSDDGDVVTGSIRSNRPSSNIDDVNSGQKEEISLSIADTDNAEQKDTSHDTNDLNIMKEKEDASVSIIDDNDNIKQQVEDSLHAIYSIIIEEKKDTSIHIIDNDNIKQEDDSLNMHDYDNFEQPEAYIDFTDENHAKDETKIETTVLKQLSSKENELLEEVKLISTDQTDDLLPSHETNTTDITKEEDKNERILHSGEFHDALLPTKINRRPTSAEKDLKIV